MLSLDLNVSVEIDYIGVIDAKNLGLITVFPMNI